MITDLSRALREEERQAWKRLIRVLGHELNNSLDRLLINLVRNATDAVLADSTAGTPEVEIAWQVHADDFFLTVRGNGPGIAETANLFVPFFTTKPSGSGSGLALCRQITEAHDGSLHLRNRSGQRGAEALVQLPLG